MTKNYSEINSSILEVHTRLVNLIMEEAELLRKAKSKREKERHNLILGFLIDLQCLTSKELKNEGN